MNLWKSWHLPYISGNRLSVKSPIFNGSLQAPICQSNPQPWWLGVTSFIYLYIGDLSHDRYQSFSRCIFLIHSLSSRCTISYLIAHSFLSYRSFIPSSRSTYCHCQNRPRQQAYWTDASLLSSSVHEVIGQPRISSEWVETDHSRTCWRNLRLRNIRSSGRLRIEAEVTRFGTREGGMASLGWAEGNKGG